MKIGSSRDEYRRQETKKLNSEDQVNLFVVENGQQLILSHCLGVDKSPEVTNHPHGRRSLILILLLLYNISGVT